MAIFDRFQLSGRTIFLSGGSRGLGRAMAQALAEAGADLILVSRDEASLKQAQEELRTLGRQVYTIPGDVGTPEGAEIVCQQALHLGVPIDGLVNNVGGRRLDVAIENCSLADWKRLVDLNLTSALVCSQRLAKPMLERGRGVVINVTSIAGPIAIRGIGGRHYETAKAALTALTKSMAADWASRGVRVNAIAPGVFETAPNKLWFGEKPEFKQGFVDHVPMGRLGDPEELGAAAVFLASDASSYMTGATLVIDGGFTLW
jgi:NAD(P)-dependent dehydrogenase (short-subunit alcohol dehydrogenase family)